MQKRQAEPSRGTESVKAVAIQAQGDKATRKTNKLLQQMQKNPRSDWTIEDFQSLADAIGLKLATPTRGSHYKASSPLLPGILTIPARKPIKVPYVRKFVALSLAHIARGAEEDENG